MSLILLLDALRRIKEVTYGLMHIETWQMVWHIWSFAFVVISGTILCIATHATFHHAGWFYFCYYLLLVCIFLTELPFIYILNNVIN